MTDEVRELLGAWGKGATITIIRRRFAVANELFFMPETFRVDTVSDGLGVGGSHDLDRIRLGFWILFETRAPA